jgi:hypothetical protein
MKELHPEQVTDIHSNALWSKEEEKLLANIPAVYLLLSNCFI